MRTIIVEAMAVALVGGVLGLAANALSPKGIAIGRNYFPSVPVAVSSTNTHAAPDSGTNTPAVAISRIEALGITLVDSNYVAAAFQDPARLQNLLIFIDAREDTLYQQGHIPGAYQLDYYRPGPYLPIVMPAAQAANTVIIYCNGGECEDSEFVAVFLKDAGIPVQKLNVYTRGFAEWSTNGMPVEIGGRSSGQFRTP